MIISENSETLMRKIIKDPTAVYDEPEEVLEDERFTTRQKQKILESWHADVEALLRAEGENMTSTEMNSNTAVILRKICKIERKLNA